MKAKPTTRDFRVNQGGDLQVLPETRRGTVAIYKPSGASQALSRSMAAMDADEHYHAITKRIEKFTARTHADLDRLRIAIEEGDSDLISETARRLTDHTGRMGAMKMMRLAIALQMLARRDMLDKAREICVDLDREFDALKATYVVAS